MVAIETVSVVRRQDVLSVHEGSWERQFPDQFLLAVRTLPSDQRRIGFVVPVEPCVLGRLGVGQLQDGILEWLPLFAAASSMA